jgi:hypothetical protein
LWWGPYVSWLVEQGAVPGRSRPLGAAQESAPATRPNQWRDSARSEANGAVGWVSRTAAAIPAQRTAPLAGSPRVPLLLVQVGLVTSKPTRRAQRDPEPPEFKTRPRLRQTDSTRQQAVRNQGSIQKARRKREKGARARSVQVVLVSAMDRVRGSAFLLGVLLAGTTCSCDSVSLKYLFVCLFVLLLYTVRCEMRSGAGVIFGSGVVP